MQLDLFCKKNCLICPWLQIECMFWINYTLFHSPQKIVENYFVGFYNSFTTCTADYQWIKLDAFSKERDRICTKTFFDKKNLFFHKIVKNQEYFNGDFCPMQCILLEELNLPLIYREHLKRLLSVEMANTTLDRNSNSNQSNYHRQIFWTLQLLFKIGR